MPRIIIPGKAGNPDFALPIPTGQVELAPEWGKVVSSATLSRDIPFRASKNGVFAKTGTITEHYPTPKGIAVKGDGSTGYFRRSVAVTPQAGIWAMWHGFGASAVNVASKTAYCLSSSTAGGAVVVIRFGDTSFSYINCGIRSVDGGTFQSLQGPTPEVSGLYTVVFVCPTGTASDSYAYINGVKYTGATGDISFGSVSTLANESFGVLYRTSPGSFGDAQSLLSAHGVGIKEHQAKEVSLNPYQIFKPANDPVFFIPSAGGTTHATTGALTGPGSTVAGTAVRFRAHPTSGVLTGPGSEVAGTARRFRDHPSTGTLTGPGSAVAGSANRFRAHPTTGALAGPGSTVAGTANRFRAHPSTGVLTGPGSTVAGSASRSTSFSILSVDGDNTIYHGQTGVIILPGSGVFGSSGNLVQIEQGAVTALQTVTAEDSSSITITVNLSGMTVPGSGTLRVMKLK